eukprot:scaffold108454_cov76-Phaeocystis_antarctica.AAC.9
MAVRVQVRVGSAVPLGLPGKPLGFVLVEGVGRVKEVAVGRRGSLAAAAQRLSEFAHLPWPSHPKGANSELRPRMSGAPGRIAELVPLKVHHADMRYANVRGVALVVVEPLPAAARWLLDGQTDGVPKPRVEVVQLAERMALEHRAIPWVDDHVVRTAACLEHGAGSAVSGSAASGSAVSGRRCCTPSQCAAPAVGCCHTAQAFNQSRCRDYALELCVASPRLVRSPALRTMLSCADRGCPKGAAEGWDEEEVGQGLVAHSALVR